MKLICFFFVDPYLGGDISIFSDHINKHIFKWIQRVRLHMNKIQLVHRETISNNF